MLINIFFTNSDPMEHRGSDSPYAALLTKPAHGKCKEFPLFKSSEQQKKYFDTENARRDIARLTASERSVLAITDEKLKGLGIVNGSLVTLDDNFASAAAGDSVWLAQSAGEDGRGPSHVVAVFTTEAEARKLCWAAEPLRMTVARDLTQHQAFEQKALHAAAKGKLGEGARKLLGL